MASSRRLPTNPVTKTYGPGKDYEVLSLWEDYSDVDCVGTTTSYILDCDKGTYDDAVGLAGATTNSSYFRLVRAKSGDEHKGIAANGVIFNGTSIAGVYGDTKLEVGENYSRFHDIAVTCPTSGKVGLGARNGYTGYFVGCIAYDITYGLLVGTGSGVTGYFIDCLAYNCGTGVYAETGKVTYCYNVTCADNTTNFANGTGIAINCISEDATTRWGTGWTKSFYTDNGGVVFANQAGDDYHLGVTDTVARGLGFDLSADATYAFDDDIDLTTRDVDGVDSYVELMLHLDGADAGTTFTDETGLCTITANGNAQTDTAIKKIGTASLLLDGTGDYLAVSDNADLNFGLADFTIDGWIYGGAQGVGYPIFVTSNSGGVYGTGSLFFADTVSSGYPAFTIGSTRVIASDASIADSAWHHLAVSRSSGVFYFFVDGVLKGTNSSYTTTNCDFTSTTIGFATYSPSNTAFAGNIDEVRISKGIARWTSSFTPRTTPYESWDIGFDEYSVAGNPNAPTTPSPATSGTGYGEDQFISCLVTDPNLLPMDVSFYNNAGDVLIGTVLGVASGARAEVIWQGLTPSTSYTWYAIADNGSGTATSVDWTFTSGAENWFWRLSASSTWRFYLAGIKILSWTTTLLTFKKKIQADGGVDLNGEINIVCDDDDVITDDGNIIYYL